MSKRIGIIGILLLYLSTAIAQDKWTFTEVDTRSYDLYQQQKWHELVDYALDAENHGFNYFNLQARIAIAYFNLKKYRTSSDLFLKLWEGNPSLEWLQEYVYYSLLYSGRAAEATKLASGFSPGMQTKINYKPAKLKRLALEGGVCFNPDFNSFTNETETPVYAGEDYGEAFYLKNYHFESIDLSHQIAPGISLNHNFTNIGVTREEQVFWGETFSFPIKINQSQYFINPYIILGKKLHFSPSLNAVWGSSKVKVGSLDANLNKGFSTKMINYSDFIFSTSLWSHFGNFAPGAEVNLANINDGSFTQLSTWVTFYPFSNANIYFTPRVYFKGDKNNSLAYNTFGISGGVQIGPVHVYSQYLNGDMKNFIESAGYVVANFPGSSEQKLSTSIYFPFGKKYQFVVRYIHQNIVEDYMVYTEGIHTNTIEYKYIKHTLTTGISWNF